MNTGKAQMPITWAIKPFDELHRNELYAILQLRNEVFIVEQDCPYQDLDNKDLLSYHLMGWQQDRLVAYTRLLPAGLAFEYPSIGRVVTSPAYRRTGAGKELMARSIEACYTLFGKTPIRIGAQLYLKKFYEGFSFGQTGELYLEDGIEHIEMTKP